MPKRLDVSQLALKIVEETTGIKSLKEGILRKRIATSLPKRTKKQSKAKKKARSRRR